MKRDNISKEQAIARINSQMPVEEICRRADKIVRNSKNRAYLVRQIQTALHGRFIYDALSVFS